MQRGEILKDYSDAFVRFLQAQYPAQGGGHAIEVKLGSPNDDAIPSPSLLVSLYQITLDPFHRNEEFVEFDPQADQTAKRTPPALHLNLHYLLVPYAATASDAQLYLGTAMAAIHAEGRIPDGSLSATMQDHVNETGLLPLLEAEDLSLDDLNKIWASAPKGMRLGVGYRLSVVRIDAKDGDDLPVVGDKKVGLRLFEKQGKDSAEFHPNTPFYERDREGGQ